MYITFSEIIEEKLNTQKYSNLYLICKTHKNSKRNNKNKKIFEIKSRI